MEVSQGPVSDPKTRSMAVQHLTQSYVWEYITIILGIYWIMLSYFHEILLCKYNVFGNNLQFEIYFQFRLCFTVKIHKDRGCAKDWTVTGPQDQLRSGLTGPPSSFAVSVITLLLCT